MADNCWVEKKRQEVEAILNQGYLSDIAYTFLTMLDCLLFIFLSWYSSAVTNWSIGTHLSSRNLKIFQSFTFVDLLKIGLNVLLLAT